MPTASKQPDDSGRRLRRLASLTAAAKSLMSEQAGDDSVVNEPSSMNGSRHSPVSTSISPDSAEFDTAHSEESSVGSVWWTPSLDGTQTVVRSSSAAAADKMHIRPPDSPDRQGAYLSGPGRVAGTGVVKQQSPSGSPAGASSPGHNHIPVPAAGVAGSGAVKQQSPAGSPANVISPGHSRTSVPAAGLAKVNSETAAVVSAMNSIISGERPGSPLGRYNSSERSDLLLMAMQQIQQLQQRVQAKKSAKSTEGGTPAATAPKAALQSAGAKPASPTDVSRNRTVPLQQPAARPAAGTTAARLPGQAAAQPASSSQLEPLQLLSPAASAALHSGGSNAHKDEQYQCPTAAQAEAGIETALAALQRGAPSLELWSGDGSNSSQSKQSRNRRGSQLVISAAVQATGSPPQHSNSGSGTSGTTTGPANTSAATNEMNPGGLMRAYSSDLYRTSSTSTPVNSSAANAIPRSQSDANSSRSGLSDGTLLGGSAEQRSLRGTHQQSTYDADSSRLDRADSGTPDPASISRPGTSCESHCEPRSLENSQVFADTSPRHGATAAPAAAGKATEDGGRQGSQPSSLEAAWAAATTAAVAQVDKQSSPVPSAASPAAERDMPEVDLAAAIAAATAALDRYGALAAAAAQQPAAAAAVSPSTAVAAKGFTPERSPSPQSVYGSPQPQTPAPSPALGTSRAMSPAAGATSSHGAASLQQKYDEQHRHSSPTPAGMQSPDTRQQQSRLSSGLNNEQSTPNYGYGSGPAVETDPATAAKMSALQTAADALDQSILEKKRAMAAAAALLASGDSGRAQAIDSDAYVATLQDLLQQLKQLEQTKQKLQNAVGRLQQGHSISGSGISSAGMSVLGEQIYAGGGVARPAQRNASPADAAPIRSSLRKISTDSPDTPAAPPSPGGSRSPQRTVSFKGYNSNDGSLPPPPPAQDADEVLKPTNSSRSYHGSSLTRRRSHSLDHERAAEAAAAAATAADGGNDGDAPMEGYANIWTAQRSRATSTVGSSALPTRGRSGGGSYRDAYALYTASKRSLAGGNAGMLAALQSGPQGLGYTATGDGFSSSQAGELNGRTSMYGSHRRSSAAEGEEQQHHQLEQQDSLLGSASRSLQVMLTKAASSIRSRGSGTASSANAVSPTKIGANAGARQWHQNLRTPPGSTAGQQQPRQGRTVTPERKTTPSGSFNARSGITTPESSLKPQRSVTPERVHKTLTRSPWETGTLTAAGGRYGKLGTWTAGGSSGSKKLGARRLGGTQQYERGNAAQYGVGQTNRTPTRSPRTTGPAPAAPAAPATPASKVGSVYSESPSNVTGSRRVTGQCGVDRRSTTEQQSTAPQQPSNKLLPQQQYHSPPRPLSHQQQQSQGQQQPLSYTASNYGGDSSARGSRGPSVAYPVEGFFLSREPSTTAAGIPSPKGSPRNSSASDPKMLQLMQVLADFQAGEIPEQDLRASLELVLMSRGGQQDMFMGSQQQQMLQQFWHTGGLSPVGGRSPRGSLSPARGADNPLDKWQAWQQQQQQQQQQSGGGASSMSPSRQSSRPNSMFGRQLSKMLSMVQDLNTSGGGGGSAEERVHESNFTVYSRGRQV